ARDTLQRSERFCDAIETGVARRIDPDSSLRGITRKSLKREHAENGKNYGIKKKNRPAGNKDLQQFTKRNLILEGSFPRLGVRPVLVRHFHLIFRYLREETRVFYSPH